MNSERIKKLEERYLELLPATPVADIAVVSTESRLNIHLPDDLKAIAKFFGGDLLGGIGNYRFSGTELRMSVANETLRIRQAINLPSRFVVLAEPPESLIVLDTHSGVVSWCGGHDVMNLAKGQPLSGPVTEWSNYADYFEHLLDAEVEERRWSEEDI